MKLVTSRQGAMLGMAGFWPLSAVQAVGIVDFGPRGFACCLVAAAASAVSLALIDVLAALATNERRLAYRLGRADERFEWLVDEDEPPRPPLYLVR